MTTVDWRQDQNLGILREGRKMSIRFCNLLLNMNLTFSILGETWGNKIRFYKNIKACSPLYTLILNFVFYALKLKGNMTETQ